MNLRALVSILNVSSIQQHYLGNTRILQSVSVILNIGGLNHVRSGDQTGIRDFSLWAFRPRRTTYLWRYFLCSKIHCGEYNRRRILILVLVEVKSVDIGLQGWWKVLKARSVLPCFSLIRPSPSTPRPTSNLLTEIQARREMSLTMMVKSKLNHL